MYPPLARTVTRTVRAKVRRRFLGFFGGGEEDLPAPDDSPLAAAGEAAEAAAEAGGGGGTATVGPATFGPAAVVAGPVGSPWSGDDGGGLLVAVCLARSGFCSRRGADARRANVQRWPVVANAAERGDAAAGR